MSPSNGRAIGMVKRRAGTKSRGQCGKKRSFDVVVLAPAEASEDLVAGAEVVVSANIEVVPDFYKIGRILVILQDRAAARINRRRAVWFRKCLQVGKTDRVYPPGRDYVRLGPGSLKLQARERIDNLDGSAQHRAGRASCCSSAEKFRKISGAHQVRRDRASAAALRLVQSQALVIHEEE